MNESCERQPYNVGVLFVEASKADRDRVLIELARSSLEAGRLADLAVWFAVRLADQGVGRGAIVAIRTRHPSVATGAYLAAGLLGAAWVSGTRAALDGRLGITHVVHDSDIAMPKRPGIVEIDRSWATPPAGLSGERLRFPGYASPDDPWMFAQSSGTTGTPKVMAVSHRLFVERLRAFDPRRTFPDGSFVAGVPTGPLTFNSATGVVGAAMYNGRLVMGDSYEHFRLTGVRYVACTPAQHASLLRGIEPPPPDRRIAGARVGGARATRTFLKMLARYYANVAIGYGSSEVSTVCHRKIAPDDPDPDDLGRPLGGAEVEIVDSAGASVAAGVEGIVRLRTPLMVAGYIGDPETTATAFRDGWFYPGDLGVVSQAGSLRITGRTNDQFALGGGKINALLIDQALETVASVADGIGFVEDGPDGVPILSAVVALHDGARPEASAGAIRKACADTISPVAAPVYVYVADEVPRNARGKAARHEAAELVGKWARY